MAPRLADVHRIAVLRANGIGDLMFALPAMSALREAYPEALITLLGAPWHRELLAARPAPVDEVVVVPAYQGVRQEPGERPDPEQAEEFFAEMRERHFDLALQMHGGGANSNPFVRRLGARLSVGLRAEGAPPLDLEIPYHYYQSEVLRLLEVVGLVGAPPMGLEAELTVTAADLAEAAAVLPEEPSPLAVLNPGAGDPRRRWPAESFAAVGDSLAEAGATVAVVGGPGDAALGSAVERAMARPVRNLTGRLGLGGLAGLLSRCAVLVSNDSGPLHLGAAVGAATVSIYWCGNLINAGPPFRARHRPQLSWRLECPVCGLDCTVASCPHQSSFVAEIPVAEVGAAALDLLAARRGGRSGESQKQGGGGGQRN